MVKKEFKNYVEDCKFKGCDTKGKCKGCYGEYLNEKKEIDPYIHSLVLKLKLEGKLFD